LVGDVVTVALKGYVYGQLSSVYGQLSSVYGQLSSVYGQLSSVYGQLSYGQVTLAFTSC
jgi:hypothetical protein